MLFTVLVLFIGYAFNLSNCASISSLPLSTHNKTIDNTHEINNETGFVKLQPGSKIYFYNTEDDKLIIGPKLQSEKDISINILDQDEDLKKISQFKNSYTKRSIYSVSKSGVLVPKPWKKGDEEKCNECVYQSLKPTYYVKGFKNILIPIGILYPKSKQEKLLKNLDSKTTNYWRTDLKVSSLEETNHEDQLEEHSENEYNDKNWAPIKNSKSSPLNLIQETKKSTLKQPKTDLVLSSEADDISPDKTCDGEITLFLLENDGIFKRIPSDPFLPAGLRLSYSVLHNLLFKPKFLGDSDLNLSYVTGKNGDLIPHPENLHKVEADGTSVSFMLSKNGGMFPVKEQKDDESISYYYNGNLVHKSKQFTETFSNSTSILVNKKKFQIFESVQNGVNSEPFDLTEEMIEEEKVNRTKKHHLQKRDIYYSDYPRGVRDPGLEGPALSRPLSGLERPAIMRQPPPPPMDDSSMIRAAPGMEGPGIIRQPVSMEGPTIIRQPASMEGSVLRSAPVLERRMNDFPPTSPRMREQMMARQPPPMPEPDMMPPPEPISTDVLPSSSRASCDGSCRSKMYMPPSPSPQTEMEGPEVMEGPLEQPWENPPLRPRSDIFIFDDKGTRIRLIPEITENNDVVIYKLTCKGNLVRYPSCKEPEFGFNIKFQILLDEFVLVPTAGEQTPFHLTYTLQENGDLIPTECNTNTYRKAPGSLIYYMLGKNNVLFPVQQVVDLDGFVSFYYQDFFLLKMKDSTEKPLHFSTKGAPLFAFFNGFTMITISSKPRLNPLRGSNWRQLKPTPLIEGQPKAIYLNGPKGEVIRVAPYKNKQGATVVYELDCNGIFYRSPKDKKKCIILKSYILMKEGILIPSNDTTGYVYMMSKNGDLFPYLYPDGKIEAPLASSQKYVLCEKGILLPIKLEIVDNYICYFFNDVVVYKERVYCKSCLDRLDEETIDAAKRPKSSCDMQPKESDKIERAIKLFINKDGDYVFYERENKILRRYPPETVPSYLKYTMGSFEVKSDGSLYQIRYQDPSQNVINLMLEPNGDLLEDSRNINKVRTDFYVLDSKGNLIAVEVKKTKKNLYFYKNGVRLCRVPIPEQTRNLTVVTKEEKDERKTPILGKDPMGLMKDPIPSKKDSEPTSLYIPIPLKSVQISENPESCSECSDNKKKCEILKETLKQGGNNTSLPFALELELTDDIIHELKNWASKCDKVLSRRDLSENLRNYINNLTYVGSMGNNE